MRHWKKVNRAVIFCGMDIHLIVAPYDSGRRAWRMGGGPEHLVRSGLIESLRRAGHTASAATLESSESDAVLSSFDLARQIAGHVDAAERAGAFPIVLAGNCIASVGAFAGLESRTAMLWLDAHADFNTPATSPSGFLDGMSLAIMTGRCMEDQSGTIGGFEPLADRDLIMLGVRALDEGEKAALARVQVVQTAEDLRAALARIGNPELYIHFDLDAVDPDVLTANHFATADGISRETLLACIAAAAADKHVRCLAITAYDPASDKNNVANTLVMDILRTLLPPVPAKEPFVPKPT